MTNNPSQPEKSPQALREENTVNFWKEGRFFEESLLKEAPKGDCVFYDGPPFATGLPHYGHILGGTGKDAIARYKTMQGYRVPRRWGWDTHGLPIETIVEKSLGITSKKQIEEMGLDVFSREARAKVLGFVSDWKKTVDRTGRWVNFDGSYKTMDATFMESVWWALGELNKKGLIYEADRILPYCPRCQTPLANAEIAMDNSYKDIVDISVYVKMQLSEKQNEYFVAWTTTPWTLPGNTALAIHPELTYVKVSFEGGYYYIGKDRVEAVFKDKQYEIVEEVPGMKLVGISYLPPFDYFRNMESSSSWKTYPASFVTADTGTGIVHIAPSFGEDDARLAKENGIPAIKHVALDGTFIPEVVHFAGMQVKPKDDHQAGDVEIIKYLAHNHLLFSKEKITHSYPHCYRCETPLLYYGLPSWFIKVQEFKSRLLELNQEISWMPEHLRDGRFKHVLENAPDWNFSRNRFWATPLPIWKSKDGKVKFISSLGELREHTKRSGNNYYIMRHGQAGSNVSKTWDFLGDENNVVTEIGEKQICESAEMLKDKSIDIIIASPLLRTKRTAELAAECIGFKGEIVFDDRLKEFNPGKSWQGKLIHDYLDQFTHYPERYLKENPDGETYSDIRRRVMEALYEYESKYQGKNILIVSHGSPILNMIVGATGIAAKDIQDDIEEVSYPKNAEVRELDFVPFPHNEEYELDLHRPYIDNVVLVDEDGAEYFRIPEVIDCWFESGSMPFAQDHFPFESEKWQDANFPSDFVVEYIAQTRTWFYYTLLVSTILFNKSPFTHIVTTGNLNGTDGQKMSKSKGNYPDPWILMNKYGADALRMYLMSSVLMKGEDSNFMEKSVDEIYKKIILRLENCLSFIDMYQVPIEEWREGESSSNILDMWITSRLSEVIEHTTSGMENYNLVEATSGFHLFVDDLSAWYLRRSRDRFKTEEKEEAGKTLITVLKKFSKVIAPIMPFMAEEIHQKLKNDNDASSVHLEKWPVIDTKDTDVLEKMLIYRDLVAQGLELRSRANIKVRQPLSVLKVKRMDLNPMHYYILMEELNVKKVEADSALDVEVFLDTTLTPELVAEGNARELVRKIQEMRKEADLMPEDRVRVSLLDTTPEWYEVHKDMILQTVGAKDIVWGSDEQKVEKM